MFVKKKSAGVLQHYLFLIKFGNLFQWIS